jgi:hypothetical protein
MSAAIDDKLCEAWIVECRGGYSVSFSQAEHDAWLEVFQSGDVTLDMFVTEDGTVLKEDAREMWAIILDEWEKLILSNGGDELRPIRSAKILAWCIAPTLVTRDGTGGLAALADAAISAVAVAATPVKTKVVTAKKAVVKEDPEISAQQEADMLAQGVKIPEQLMQIYISVQLGRIANEDEYEGLSYQMHWTSAKGMKQIAKNPSGLGQKTLAQHLEAARVDGNLAPVDKFIQRTADKFMLSDRAVFMIAGSRLLSRWSRAKTFCPADGRVAANYLALFWDDLPGRGIPEIVDFDLVRDAERAVAAQGPAPSGVGLEALTIPKARSASGSEAGSTVSWGVSSAASSASTKKLEDMMVAMQEALGGQMKALASEVNGIKKGHGDLASRIGQMRPPTGGGGGAAGRKCYFCEQKGHTQAECPMFAKMKKEAQKGAQADDE